MIKHWIVTDLSISTVDNHFKFIYEIPKTWLPEQEKEKQQFIKDLCMIAEYPLRNNLIRLQTMRTLREIRVPAEELPDRVLSKPINDPPCSLRMEVCEIIKREALKLRTKYADPIECMKEAKKILFLVGQNHHFIADPSRDCKEMDLDLKEDDYKQAFIDSLKKDKVSIRILLLNPLNTDEVIFWHKLLIKKNPGKKPDFIGDLKVAMEKFRSWMNEAEGLNLDVRCGDFALESAILVDPKEENGWIVYKRTVQDAISHPLRRPSIVCRKGDLDYEDRVDIYLELFSNAVRLREVQFEEEDWNRLKEKAR